jgi:diacylglycerol kinase (ATP)
MLAAVSNGACVGGGFRLTPDARPDDGQLDLCVVAEVGLGVALRVMPRVLRGTHAGHPSVTLMRAPAFELCAIGDGPLWLQLDGELRRLDTDRVHMEVMPGALPVLTRAPGQDIDGMG